MNATQNEMVRYLVDHPEFVLILPMCCLCFMLWYLIAKHFPFLLEREDRLRVEAAAREDRRSSEITGAVKELTQAILVLDRNLSGGVRKRGESTRRKTLPSTGSTE